MAQDDPHQHVLLPLADAESGDGLGRELVAGRLGQDGDLLHGIGVRAESLPDAVAEVLGHLDPFAVPAHVQLAAVGGVGVDAGLPPPGAAGGERLDQQAGHLLQVVVAQGSAGDAPQVELVRRWTVESVDGVAPVDHPGHTRSTSGAGSAARARRAAGIMAVAWLRSMRSWST
jgi:hypothetical protein